MKISKHYLEDLQEAETYLWVKTGLERLEDLVRSNGDDEELLDLISYLKQDNEDWCAPDFLQQADQSPKSLSS